MEAVQLAEFLKLIHRTVEESQSLRVEILRLITLMETLVRYTSSVSVDDGDEWNADEYDSAEPEPETPSRAYGRKKEVENMFL